MAQLKSTSVTGNLSVTGNILASKIIKLGGTADEILCADGSTTTLGGFGAGTVTSVTVIGNNGLTGTGTITSSGTITLSHDDTSDVADLTATDRTYVKSLTFDSYGHVTGYTTGAETVTSYFLPLAANGTRGGIQIGYSSTENNRAVSLSSEKAYVALPDRLTDFKGTAENSPSTSGWYFFNDTSSDSAKTAFGNNAQAATWVSAYSNSWAAQLGVSYYSNGIAFRRKNNSTSWSDWVPIATQEWVEGLGYVTGSYLPLAGGQMSGPITYPIASGNNKSSNYISAGGGFAAGSGKEGLKILALEQSDATMGLGVDLAGGPYELTVATSRSSNSTASKIVFATHTVGSTAYKALATLSASGAENPVVTFNVAGAIQENGASLADKYLGINAQAADSKKLDGKTPETTLSPTDDTKIPTSQAVAKYIAIQKISNVCWADQDVATSKSINTTPTFKSITFSDGNTLKKASWTYNSTSDCVELVWE